MSFDVRKNRQINLQRVVKTLGISKVLELTGRQRSQVSDCAAGRRTIGEKLARSFETELGLEPGCLDLPLIEGEGLSIKPVGQRQVPLLSWLSVRSGLKTPMRSKSLTSPCFLFSNQVTESSLIPTLNLYLAISSWPSRKTETMQRLISENFGCKRRAVSALFL